MVYLSKVSNDLLLRGLYFLTMKASTSQPGQYSPISEFFMQLRVHPQPIWSFKNAKEKYHNLVPTLHVKLCWFSNLFLSVLFAGYRVTLEDRNCQCWSTWRTHYVLCNWSEVWVHPSFYQVDPWILVTISSNLGWTKIPKAYHKGCDYSIVLWKQNQKTGLN